MMKGKESIFVPCGHKCCCVECAEKIFTSNRNKCPCCNVKIKFILKKIFDS